MIATPVPHVLQMSVGGMTLMDTPWLVRLDQTLSSYSILATILGGALLLGLLNQFGLLGWIFAQFGRFTRWAIRSGFGIWERWLSWANWWVYLLLALALITPGALAARSLPVVTLCCAVLALSMGVATCLAY